MLRVRESVFREWRSGYLDSPRDLHEDQHSNKDSLKVASAKHFSKADSSLSRWESRKSSGSFRIGYYWISLGCEELWQTGQRSLMQEGFSSFRNSSHRLEGGVFDPTRLVPVKADFLHGGSRGLYPWSKWVLGLPWSRGRGEHIFCTWGSLVCQPQGLGSHRVRILCSQTFNV